MESVLWFALAFALVGARPQTISPDLNYENCGPPFKLTITPYPIKFRQVVNITLEFVAEYDLIAGVVEAYVNTWPYHYKDAFCAGGKMIDPQGCYISKGDKRTIATSFWLDDDFKLKKYEVNGTLTNERNEMLLCVRATVDLI